MWVQISLTFAERKSWAIPKKVKQFLPDPGKNGICTNSLDSELEIKRKKDLSSVREQRISPSDGVIKDKKKSNIVEIIESLKNKSFDQHLQDEIRSFIRTGGRNTTYRKYIPPQNFVPSSNKRKLENPDREIRKRGKITSTVDQIKNTNVLLKKAQLASKNSKKRKAENVVDGGIPKKRKYNVRNFYVLNLT